MAEGTVELLTRPVRRRGFEVVIEVEYPGGAVNRDPSNSPPSRGRETDHGPAHGLPRPARAHTMAFHGRSG